MFLLVMISRMMFNLNLRQNLTLQHNGLKAVAGAGVAVEKKIIVNDGCR
jgi:hypothetical protein